MEKQMVASAEGQFVTFLLSEEEFGIPIGEVQEIVKPSAITSVPGAPGYVKGIANLRGNILPVMDLRARLGIPAKEEDEDTRVIVLNTENKTTGLVVDRVSDVLHVERTEIETPPDMLQSVDRKYIDAVAKTQKGERLTLILSTATVLPEKTENKGLATTISGRANERAEEGQETQEQERLVVAFTVGGEEFGVDIMEVREIIRVGEITHVPEAPDFVLGLASLRNMLLPIVDLRSVLSIPPLQPEETQHTEGAKEGSEVGDTRRIVIININAIPIGLLVDSVSQVLRLSESSVDPPPAIINGTQRSRLRGVARLEGGRRLVMLLDTNNIVDQEEGQLLAELREEKEECMEMAGEVADEEQVVCFRVDEEEYGIEIMKVQEIIRLAEITSVPNAPEYVKGIINLRGNVLPVIDMRTHFGMEQASETEQNRIIVVDGSGMRTGIIVDSVSEVLRIPKGQVEPPPEVVLGGEGANEYLRGVGKLDEGRRIIMLLDIDKLLEPVGKEDLAGIVASPTPTNSSEANQKQEEATGVQETSRKDKEASVKAKLPSKKAASKAGKASKKAAQKKKTKARSKKK